MYRKNELVFVCILFFISLWFSNGKQRERCENGLFWLVLLFSSISWNRKCAARCVSASESILFATVPKWMFDGTQSVGVKFFHIFRLFVRFNVLSTCRCERASARTHTNVWRHENSTYRLCKTNERCFSECFVYSDACLHYSDVQYVYIYLCTTYRRTFAVCVADMLRKCRIVRNVDSQKWYVCSVLCCLNGRAKIAWLQ